MSKNFREAADKVFLFGFPLVVTEISHWGQDGKGFVHKRDFPDVKDQTIVKMNNDTLYSTVSTQLHNTPYIAHVPDIKDRYYLFPILDAYTNVVESIGTRTPEKSAGDYILLLEGSEIPEEYKSYRPLYFKNSLNSILLRIETRGKSDYKYVNSLQDQFIVKPVYPEKLDPVPASVGAVKNYVVKLKAEEFYSILASAALHNPIYDKEVLDDFIRLGYDHKTGTFDFTGKSAEEKQDLEDSVKEGIEYLKNSHYSGKLKYYVKNGWFTATGGLGVYGDDYITRASVALSGWGANIPEDSIYSSILTDSNGEKLDSDKVYRFHFDAEGYPHASHFWSLTLYGEPSFYLVDNEINRYVINTYDVNDGVVRTNPDGSLDIYISKDRPVDPGREKNWLPAPKDEKYFSLVIRNYTPDKFTLEGKWVPPVVEVVDQD